MQLKNYIEKHPAVYLLGIIVTVSTIVFGISEYFCRQRMEIASQKAALDVSTLQTELTSIRRGLGDSKFLDVRSFVVPKGRSQSLPTNPRSKYVSPEDLYAITEMPGWTYERHDSVEYFKQVLNMEMSPTLHAILQNRSVLMWRGPNFVKVEALIHDDVFLHTAGPMIIIDRSSRPEILKAGEHIPAIVEESSGEKIEFTADELKDIRAVLERMYQGDASAIILANVMSEELSNFESPDIDIQLVEIQKVANVVYAQFLMTLRNAKVDGKKTSLLFLREEYLIVTDQDGSTIIHVTVPRTDPAPRGRVYSQIQEWFSGLAIQVR
jgi:hypothetical protein